MSEPPRKPRFADPSTLPADPALRVLALRPKGTTPAAGEPVTFVGRLASDANLGLQTQLEQLRAEREGGRVILSLDPKLIAITEFANRHAASLEADDPKMQELKASLRRNGQDQPVRIRPAADGAALPYELVEGHRRLAAILALDTETDGGYPIQARLDVAARDTRDLALKMYRENEERFDLSAFEKGAMFQKWLDAGLYRTAREIAEAVSTSEQTVGKYLALAALPPAILAAFADVRDIPVRAVSPLAQAIKTGGAAVLKQAERLAVAQPRPSADEVIRALLTASTRSPAGKRTGSTREESVKIGGRIPLKVASGPNRIHLKFAHVDSKLQKQLAEELKDWAEAWLRKRLEDPK